MTQLNLLQSAKSKKDLAVLLGIKTSNLTHILYVLKASSQYTDFPISKKNGGTRKISAPSDRLKVIQKKLSNFLQDCIEEINSGKAQGERYVSTLSHGFVREKTIITNAMMHLHRKNVLNVDLKDFFESFNFGRVRGFFIKNRNFKLDPHIATVIAQIACYENKLPQGSPCSPVITNLICHALDIRLAKLACKYSCVYSRYADDITISTRKDQFPTEIMVEDNGVYIPSKKFQGEIERAGFLINPDKTRIQYKDSRQDVTGLIVNEKPNTKKEYWRAVKAQCYALFKTGSFQVPTSSGFELGNIFSLEGKLNFIDQIDRFNRTRDKPPLEPKFQLRNYGHETTILFNGREKTFSKFLYYKNFYGNTQPTILCEGETDNIYLRSAINILAAQYPKLAISETNNNGYKVLVHFFEYSKRTRFLLQLYGGTSYLKFFINRYETQYLYYQAPKPQNPVIIVLDNDSGSNGILNLIKNFKSSKAFVGNEELKDLKGADFVYVVHNLYIVLTPLNANDQDSKIEDFFDVNDRNTIIAGKKFNPENDMDPKVEYGKKIFAEKVIQANKSNINFSGLRPMLDRIVLAIEHYETIK